MNKKEVLQHLLVGIFDQWAMRICAQQIEYIVDRNIGESVGQ